MNTYEAKQEAKRERLEAAADRAESRSNSAYGRADLREEASGIPLGQPILVGHHSEGRHRRAIERADNAMRKSIAESKRAGELRAKAAAVGTGGISSDDPDAIDKLKEKLAKAEEKQAFMKAANRAVRKACKAGACKINKNTEYRAFVSAVGKIEGVKDAALVADTLLTADCFGGYGFASYQLTNNNANIKRMKDRVAQLARAADAEDVTIEYQGVCTYKENTDENRVQFLFDGKPSAEVRSILKGHGFRWAPTNNAWQRHLNNSGRYAAKMVIKGLGIEE